MLKLTRKQLSIFPRIQRKYKVSVQFLRFNMANIEKFLMYALSPRIVIKRVARRKGPKQRVTLDYYHLRRVLFDQTDLKYIKSRKRNVQQWSRQIVSYLRNKYDPNKYVEDLPFDDVSRKIKEQLDLLRSRKRLVPLIESVSKDTPEKQISETPLNASYINDYQTERSIGEGGDTEQPTSIIVSNLEKQKPNVIPNQSLTPCAPSVKAAAKSERGSSYFLDMLMNKITAKQGDMSAEKPKTQLKVSPFKRPVRSMRESLDNELSSDSSDEFYGFDETEFKPQMMRIPVVSFASKSKTGEPGVRDNNQEQSKRPYQSRALPLIWRNRSGSTKMKFSQPPVFKHCPFSSKPFQKPLDNRTAPLLPPGGNMTVVRRLPTVELEVFPAIGKPLHEVAKRYLQYIMPFEEISQKWAEFSISTLQQSISSKKDEPTRGFNSYVFSIPYLNDRSHDLVNRDNNSSEKLLEPLQLTKYSERPLCENLRFRQNLDESNAVLMECAEVVGDLINSVAINCSENSFISEDPDEPFAQNNIERDKRAVIPENTIANKIDYDKTSSLTSATGSNKKQLLVELRRMNVDAGVKGDKEENPCSKDCCRYGCVCASLTHGCPKREHCGKAQCVIDCVCRGPSQPRIKPLKNDARSITTEDAFRLRRKATARHARIEKEFGSPVVLTGNETLPINESQYSKKRRCSKAPKRYDDFVETRDDVSPTIIESTENSSPNGSSSESAAEVREPIHVEENLLDPLIDCTVPLVQQEHTNNISTWCMFHELYNCFCGGRALEGRSLAKERDTNANISRLTVSNGPDDDHVATKARNSFEKIEIVEPKAASKIEEEKNSKAEEHSLEYNSDDEESLISGDDGDSDFSIHYHPAKKLKTSNSKQKCGRPVPHKTYKRINRKRRQQNLDFIEGNKNSDTQLALNQHILRSVHFPKQEMEKQKMEMKTKEVEQEAEVNLDKNDEESIMEGKQMEKTGSRVIGEDVNLSDEVDLACKIDQQQNAAKTADIDATATTTVTAVTSTAATLQHISPSPISTNLPSELPSTSFTTSETSASALMTAGFQKVVNKMNILLNKKMQDIGMVLKRESKVIPLPNNDILCIITWKNFLEAFIEAYVFLWQVKTKDNWFIAATITEVLPLVKDAVAVMNLKTINVDAMPLLGKMLIKQHQNGKTRDLAIVLQGRPNYWLVRGFLHGDKLSACSKPNPRNHPVLTDKINTLTSLLAKQHMQLQSSQGQPQSIQKQPHPQKLQQQPQLNDILTLQQPETSSQKVYSVDQSQQPMQAAQTPPATNLSIPPQPLHELFNCEQYTNMSTNIEFRTVTAEDIDEMQGFDICQYNHRWLVLELYNDFSHLFVPELRDLIALQRIQNIMSFCRQKQKIVRLEFFPNAPFDAFVTPKSERKIYFGPLKVERQLPLLILLQSVQKQMMLREVYQAQHNIRAHPTERTTAFGLLCADGQYQFQADNHKHVLRWKSFPKQAKETEDSDDDCIIVDDTTGGQKKVQTENGSTISGKSLEKCQKGTSNKQTEVHSHRPQIMQDDESAQPSVWAREKQHQDSTLHNHRQVTNFTSANSNQLQIVPNNNQPIKSSEQQLQVLPSEALQNAPLISIDMQLNEPLVHLPSATARKQRESQVGSVPVLNMPATAVMTSVSLGVAQSEVPTTTTQIFSMPPQRNTLSISKVNKDSLQHTATTKPTKVTFSAPDVCITGTEIIGAKCKTLVDVKTSSVVTEKGNSQTVTNPKWSLPNAQTVQAHSNEVAANSPISDAQNDSLADGQTKSKEVYLIRDVANTSTVVLKKVNIKNVINLSADAKAVTQRANNIASAQHDKSKQPKISIIRNMLPQLAVNQPKINLTLLKNSGASVARRKTIADSATISSKQQKLPTATVLTRKVNEFENGSPGNSDKPKVTGIVIEKIVNPSGCTVCDTLTQAEAADKAVSMNLPKISTIGSTTIKKLDDAVVNRLKPLDPLNMTLTLAGDAFEPEASVVFKGNPFISAEKTTSNATKTSTTGATEKLLSGYRSVTVTTKSPFTVTSTSTTTSTSMATSIPTATIAQSKPTSTIGIKLSKPTVTTANVSVIAANSRINPKQSFSLPANPTSSGSTPAHTNTLKTTPTTMLSSANICLKTNVSGSQLKRCYIKSIMPVKNNDGNNASNLPAKINSQPTISTKLTPIALKKVVKSPASTNTNTVVTSSCKVTPAVSPGEYGILWCNHPSVQKFVGKRTNNYFLVKVPDVGVIHRRNIEEISSYLNQYVQKLDPSLKTAKSLTWTFFPRKVDSVLTKGFLKSKNGDMQTSGMEHRFTRSAATPHTSDGCAIKNGTGAPPPKIRCADTILLDD